MALSEKDKKKMLTMSMRERTQHRAKIAQQQAADRRKAAAQKAQAARKAEAASKPSTSKSPSFGQQAASSMTGGQPFKTKSERTNEAQAAVKPKPKPQPAAPKPKPKPQPAQTAAAKPKPKPKPEQPAAPAKGKSIAERGGPNFKDYPNSKEGLAAYDKAVANWEKTQKSGKRPVRRPGESSASFNRRMQAYLRNNRK